VVFLAEKIETREDYKKAAELGYDLFQGYYFSKPAMIKSKDIKTVNSSLLAVIDELNKTEPSYFRITDIIESDLGLSYKLLRLANSVYIGAKYKVKSITQALNYLGTRELYQWISLMILKDLQYNENGELIKQSLIRGKLMNTLAIEFHQRDQNSDYFFIGIFSLIDVILSKSFEELLVGLPLSDKVKNTLLGEKNDMRELLDCIASVERAEWDMLDRYQVLQSIGPERFMENYVEAIKWANSLGE
jgi:EAL and modified HD-GYP domain-containing signal transduction protein